jgi:hypothetical protein
MNLENNITNNLIQKVMGGPGPNSNPKKDDYRYYQCYRDLDTLKCIKVKEENLSTISKDSRLLSIKSSFPEKFDSYILRFEWMPKKVEIENKYENK